MSSEHTMYCRPMLTLMFHDGEVKALHIRTSPRSLDTNGMIVHSRQHIEHRDIADVNKELKQAVRVWDHDASAAADDDHDDNWAYLFCNSFRCTSLLFIFTQFVAIAGNSAAKNRCMISLEQRVHMHSTWICCETADQVLSARREQTQQEKTC